METKEVKIGNTSMIAVIEGNQVVMGSYTAANPIELSAHIAGNNYPLDLAGKMFYLRNEKGLHKLNLTELETYCSSCGHELVFGVCERCGNIQ